jgi:hypothetical protein
LISKDLEEKEASISPHVHQIIHRELGDVYGGAIGNTLRDRNVKDTASIVFDTVLVADVDIAWLRKTHFSKVFFILQE